MQYEYLKTYVHRLFSIALKNYCGSIDAAAAPPPPPPLVLSPSFSFSFSFPFPFPFPFFFSLVFATVAALRMHSFYVFLDESISTSSNMSAMVTGTPSISGLPAATYAVADFVFLIVSNATKNGLLLRAGSGNGGSA